MLDAYDPGSFLAELRAAGFTNMADTYSWRADHPASGAPTPAAVAAAVRNFRYHGLALTEPMSILWRLTDDTYSGHVNCGLNGGAGIGGAGIIDSGCAGLPNKGALGMLKEFDSGDGGGARSSGLYAHDGYRVNLVNHLALLAGGLWRSGAQANAVLVRLRIGVPDLWYKLAHGYRDYSKGGPMWIPDGADDGSVFRRQPELRLRLLPLALGRRHSAVSRSLRPSAAADRPSIRKSMNVTCMNENAS